MLQATRAMDTALRKPAVRGSVNPEARKYLIEASDCQPEKDFKVDMWSFISQQLRAEDCRLCRAPCRDGFSLCPACIASLPHQDLACPRCGLPLPPHSIQAGECGECLADPPPFERARIPLIYRPPLDSLIGSFKYHGSLADGRLLGELMMHGSGHRESGVNGLVPLPLHPQRLRERGFNQAAELARWAGQALDMPVLASHLYRHKAGTPQRGARRRDRQRNVRGAFDCKPLPAGSRIALIDDVVTTGATARAAAQALRKAGADHIELWAIARASRPQDD